MGGFISAVGDVQNANASANEGYINQALANFQANASTARGAQASGAAAIKAGQVIGAQRAGFAASGVDIQSGTPLETMADTRLMSSYDRATIENNAAREAWGYKTKGFLDLQKGLLGESSSVMKAGGDTIGGVAQLSSILGA